MLVQLTLTEFRSDKPLFVV